MLIQSSRSCALLVLALFAATLVDAQDAPNPPANPYEGNSEVVPDGKSLFNQYCAHCHGPDAVQGERPRDLRRLTIRYGDGARALFYATVKSGRMEKGMPPWKGTIGEDTIWRIFTFLQTVQQQP